MSRSEELYQLLEQSLILMLVISMPAIVIATAVGLVISLLQAVTQLQEQSLGFAVKLVVVFAVSIVTMPWVSGQFTQYVDSIFAALIR